MPDEFEQRIRERYLELKREGKGPVTCARGVGATVAAMNAYLAADYEFAQQVEEAEAEALERVANKQWERAQEGDWAPAIALLQAKDPDNWLKPDREMTLRLARAEEDIDVDALHKKLESKKGELPRASDEGRQAESP